MKLPAAPHRPASGICDKAVSSTIGILQRRINPPKADKSPRGYGKLQGILAKANNSRPPQIAPVGPDRDTP